ncbi:MAG: SEC-C metal-binding domain-containing protein [Desulfurellaceae bacterium]|nr:SEC-C metal-binding domain-containing protein [Desulfurellaceae bacterium]
MRKEQEIFDDLAKLCVSPGYVHAIACLCFRDNMVFYDKKEGMTADDMRPLFSSERLIRTEISTLIGLLIKEEIAYALPDPSMLWQYITKTESLLKELHDSMLRPAIKMLEQKTSQKHVGQFWTGEILREAIFYGSESAYSFQYRELSLRKYARDNRWLEDTKSFSIERVRDITHMAQKIQDEKLTKIRARYSDIWPALVLAGHTLTIHEIADRTGIERSEVEKILMAFSVPPKNRNTSFQSLNDFNIVAASPLIRYNDDSFISFQQYNLVEAMYESPFYWMYEDQNYRVTAQENRGRFTEEFCRGRLGLAFGKENVFANVDIFDSKGKKLGEIDCLVIFGDRIIVLQAKSKRLTLEARKGNDRQIKDDFKKSVQNSYDQGYRDANLLIGKHCKFTDSASNEIDVPDEIKEIYILCVVSDHYPALSFQAREFLQFEETDTIYPPFVMDVFTLDALTEMLQSPLLLLSYINRRTSYSDRLIAPNELTILSDHLKNNLWVSDGHDLFVLGNEISSYLDVAMTVRREGVPGERTPDGILTRLETTTLGRIIKAIEAIPSPATIDLGFMLLTLSENTITAISEGIDKIIDLSRKDGKGHDFTIGVREGSTGLTIHCNDDPMPVAVERLQTHCVLRKYTERADNWFGMRIYPKNVSLMLGVSLGYKWEQNDDLDTYARSLLKFDGNDTSTTPGTTKKIGRNEPCPCGSGRKYKNCCMAR